MELKLRPLPSVSQFTLYARTSKHRPDFHLSMSGVPAKEIYDALLVQLGQRYDAAKINDGVFGAMMDVSLVNDGPVTLSLESGDKK